MKTTTKATAKKAPVKKATVKMEIEWCFPSEVKEEMKKNFFKHHGKKSCGGFYFFGFIGAAVYFIGQATSFRIGVLAILKAIVRPAFLVHGLLKFLGL